MSRVPASPYLFRPVARALVGCFVALCVLAALVPAPLEIAADPSSPPNPAKSAWFLLWIQELVSHSSLAIYVVIAMALLLFTLPWLPVPAVQHAAWFQRPHRILAALVLFASFAVAALTVVGLIFRGRDWCLVMPF